VNNGEEMDNTTEHQYQKPSIKGMSKAVLVTGGAGYVGSHTCKFLAKNGFTPIVIDRDLKTKFKPAEFGPIFDINLPQEIERLEEIIKRFDITSCIHFAGSASVAESVKNPSEYYKNNVIATVVLLDKLIECGVKTFVYSSSAATYGDPGMKLCKESDWPKPISAYGASKLMMEMICKDYQRAYNLSSVGLRYFNAAGADPEAEVGELRDKRNTHHPIGHRRGQTRQDIQDVWRQVPNRGRNLCEGLRTRDGPSGCSCQGTKICIRKSSSGSVQLGIRCACLKSTDVGRGAETRR
jgi:nucleoside-diphosphate-sugar epimerase